MKTGILLALLCLPPALWAQNGDPSFIEDGDDRTLVIWKDMTIPEEKDYENVIIAKGDVEFLGSTDALVLVRGKVTLGPNAKIRQRLVVLSGSVVQTPGATLPDDDKPSTIFNKGREWLSNLKSYFGALPFGETRSWTAPFQTLALFFLWVLLVFLSGLMPSLFGNAERFLLPGQFLGSGLISLLFWLFLIPVLFLLTISIVGILAIPFVLLLYSLALIAGVGVCGRTLGSLLIRRSSLVWPHTKILELTVGVILLFALSLLPIVGRAVLMILVFVGMGAFLRAIFDGQRFFVSVR